MFNNHDAGDVTGLEEVFRSTQFGASGAGLRSVVRPAGLEELIFRSEFGDADRRTVPLLHAAASGVSDTPSREATPPAPAGSPPTREPHAATPPPVGVAAPVEARARSGCPDAAEAGHHSVLGSRGGERGRGADARGRRHRLGDGSAPPGRRLCAGARGQVRGARRRPSRHGHAAGGGRRSGWSTVRGSGWTRRRVVDPGDPFGWRTRWSRFTQWGRHDDRNSRVRVDGALRRRRGQSAAIAAAGWGRRRAGAVRGWAAPCRPS